MIKRSIVIIMLTMLALARPMPASAQQGATVGGVLAATSIGSRTEASVAGAVGYRMNRFLGFGLELTSIPTLKPEAAAENASGTDGQATVFTANVHIELPAVTARLIPYVVGGGGVANIKETFALQPAVPPGIPVVIAPQAMTRSSTDLALTAGGGVGLLAAPRVSIDVDLRYLRLMAARDRNVGRFGVGVSYRF